MFYIVDICNMIRYPRRKEIRLAKNLYQGPLVISLTLCFCQGSDVIKTGLAERIIEIVNSLATKCELENYAYCLMPDHLHWLIGLRDEKHNVLDIIRHFKSKVSYEVRGKYQTKRFWQDRFYDHILRKDEDIYKQAKYISENSVRKNLVANFTDYKYSGGICLMEFQRP